MDFIEFDTESVYYPQACVLRNCTLRKPLGLDLFSEDLSHEVHCRHFGIRVETKLIACLLIVPNGRCRVVLRQMCVAENLRHQGLGSRLITDVETALCRAGIEQIELAARVPVMPFYKTLGYCDVGEEYLSVGIPHVRMVKLLHRPDQ